VTIFVWQEVLGGISGEGVCSFAPVLKLSHFRNTISGVFFQNAMKPNCNEVLSLLNSFVAVGMIMIGQLV